jgi:2-methylcitrate dehydratase PrpD
VEEVRVGVLSAGFKLVASPEEHKRNPASVVDMQFSMPFGAAAALVFGRASLAEYALGVPERPEIKNIMDRTRCVIDPELETTFPRQFRAWAEVETKDGRTLRGDVEYPKGDPENPLTWDEMKGKFTGLTSELISRQRQQEIISSIESLESMADMRELATLLAAE